MRKTTNISIVPRGVADVANDESAQPGCAAKLVNMREREQSLQVVGTHKLIGNITVGHTLLLADGNRYLTSLGGDAYCNVKLVAQTGGQVLSACKVGTMIAVNTSEGVLCLQDDNAGSYAWLDPLGAIPSIHLCATEWQTLTATTDAYTLSQPYAQWQVPLAAADEAAYSRLMRTARSALSSQATGAGRYSAPIMARVALRLWDDSYLWIGPPVLLGGETMETRRASAEAVASDGRFTGVGAMTVQMPTYRLGITVLNSFNKEWARLIKSIDVLTTAQPAIDTGTLDYRMAISTASGSRRYVLEAGPTLRSTQAVLASLLLGKWTVVASCSDVEAVMAGKFAAAGVQNATAQLFPGIATSVLMAQQLGGTTLTNEQCKAIMLSTGRNARPATMIQYSGRLMLGGGTSIPVNTWQAANFMTGTMAKTPCTATITATIATTAGPKTLCCSQRLDFTPTALQPLLVVPDERATSVEIAFTPAAGGQALLCKSNVMLLDALGAAAAVPSDFAVRNLTAGTPQEAATTVVDDAQGSVCVSAIGNPLVVEHTATVTGSSIKAMAVASRPLYSGGFGRYPLYVFTSQGIFALPQQSSGKYGEARLVSRTAIASGVAPAEGCDAVYFVAASGGLCRIAGSKVETVLRKAMARQMAWNETEAELYMAGAGGALAVLMASGRTYSRSEAYAQLLNCGGIAMAVDASGNVYNMCEESATGSVSVEYRSCPVPLSAKCGAMPRLVTWNVAASDACLTLAVNGERGSSCHGFVVGRLVVEGSIGAPLAQRLVSPPLRTVRASIAGTLPAGTLLRQVDIMV